MNANFEVVSRSLELQGGLDIIEPLSEETLKLAQEVDLNEDLKGIVKDVLYTL